MSAQSSGTGANFLKIPVGPRPIGLGSAFTGVGDNVYTIYWNPAGIGLIRRWEISAMYNKYFADMYYGAISGLKQFQWLGSRKTGVGLGLFFHGIPEWKDDLNNEKASASNIMVSAALGQRLDWLSKNVSIGLNVKFARSTLVEYDAYTLATDFGILSRWDLFSHPFMIGATIQNIGFQTAFIKEKSPIPMGYRFGLSYRFLDCDYHHLLLATDLAKYKYSNWKLGLGAEYWFRNLIAVRSGYAFDKDDLGDFSFGVGVKLDAFNSGLQSDYTQSDFGDALGYTRSGAIGVFSVSPEPFYLISPQNGHIFGPQDTVKLCWEPVEDPDFCDEIRYRNIIDADSTKLKEMAEQICKYPTTKVQLMNDQIVYDASVRLTNLPPGTYFWNTIAIDRKGHTRLASATGYKHRKQGSESVRWFIQAAPDLIIRQIAFQPSATLPDLDDDTQGNVIIEVANIGNWTAYKFNVALSDSFDCEAITKVVAQFSVDSLRPRQSKKFSFLWKTNEIGRHHFIGQVDPDNRVFESNDSNNGNLCYAITIPRGNVFAAQEELKTKKVIFSYYEIPIVPLVFFAQGSNIVDDDFYREDRIKPMPLLKVIAERLIQHPEFKIQLAGYIDPITEKGQNHLAAERMQKVREILVDSLGVPAHQIGLHSNYDIAQRRLERAPEPMVNAENRRVEILFNSDKLEDHFALFGPLEISHPPQISDGLVFISHLKAFVDISSWQLIIQESPSRNNVYRIAFRIDPETHPIDMIDSTVWIGRDNENRLVTLNQRYNYFVYVQDRFGREFTSDTKEFYLKCDMIEDQEVQVHLNQFDSPKEFFAFNELRIDNLVERLCQSESLKVKFNGYACDIGGFSYNVNLAHQRAETYLELMRKKLKTKCPSVAIEEKLVPIDPVDVLIKKYTGHPGSYAEPFQYLNPCSLKEYVFPLDDPYGKILSRRVDIILLKKPKATEVK
ncbi:MAG: PorV/PorQ family protein [candidate division KSB1 bacterium]|nr:PorV/PorQ family protein [candidate division KSB1 bacterium]